MKTFFNVLYRRILYKIPLKLLLILVAVFGVLFACFSSANFNGYYSNSSSDYTNYSKICHGSRIQVNQGQNFCFTVQQIFAGDYYLYRCSSQGQDYNSCTSLGSLWAGTNGTYCYSEPGYYYFRDSWGSCSSTVIFGSVLTINSSCPICPTCPEQFTSSECQTEYNLIPISSVDSAYCEENNLCSSSDCPSYSGDLTAGVSNIFINDLFHPGAFNIIMNIPEEIDWDYAYTNSGQNLNIDVVGYNVDYEKMQSVIDNQNYKPSSEDLNTIVSTVVPLFIPGLVILLFLYFVFRFIKKIF